MGYLAAENTEDGLLRLLKLQYEPEKLIICYFGVFWCFKGESYIVSN